MNALRSRFPRFYIWFLLITTLVLGPASSGATVPPPPDTRTDDIREVIHGVEIMDPYRWLEDQQSPETRAWIDAQNSYIESVLSQVGGREVIREGLIPFIRYDWYGTPDAGGDYYFFRRELAGENLKSVCLRKGLSGEDEVLIDPLALSDDRSVTAAIMNVSDDGRVFAYGLQKGGEDEVVVRFYDVVKRRDLDDMFPRGRYGDVCFEPGSAGIYYSRYLDDGPRIYHHVMGADPAGDTEVFGSAYGPGIGISVDLSDDGRFLVMTVWHGYARGPAARAEDDRPPAGCRLSGESHPAAVRHQGGTFGRQTDGQVHRGCHRSVAVSLLAAGCSG